MQSVLFGYVDGALPNAASFDINRDLPEHSRTLLLRFENGAIYGRPEDVGLSSADGVVAAVAGAPKWRNVTSGLAAIANHLLHAYLADGIRALEHLTNGFIAVVIDSKRGIAHLAIDRIGRMPLAYGQGSGGLCFSTDARLVARAVGTGMALDSQALFDYAFFHAVPSPQTIFRGVAKLEPAQRAEWSAGNLKLVRHWQPRFTRNSNEPFETLRHDFLAGLKAGVEAAAPNEHTASFLSGGIDSSTVTGLLARLMGDKRPAYTIGFEQAGYDETEYARIAANHFGADLRVHYISTGEVQSCVPELAALYDEPFGNSSAVPALVCSRLAKADGIRQMLAGDGGDELFAGNARYAKQRVFEIFGLLPGWGQRAAERIFTGNGVVAKTPLRKIGSYIQQARIPLPDRIESYNFLLRENVASMFTPEFLRTVDPQHPFALMRAQYGEPKQAATLDRMLYLDWKFTLADNDLRKVTATCNRAGVDVSFPWLDDSVIDFSARLPANIKMRGTKLRYFVKRALAEFLPHATIAKSKHGFGLPFGQWLKTSADLQNQIYDLLQGLRNRDIFQPKFIDRLIEEHRGGHAAYYGTMVWVLAMLEAWLQANARDASR